MLKLNPNQLRQPYGGHQFFERGLMIRGDTFKEVVKKLTEFRINNNVPVGQPDQDILVHYVKHWPWMVLHDDNPPKQDKVSSDYESWKKWIYMVWSKPAIKTVSEKEASDRWSVCKTCPHNKGMSWQTTNESTEIARRAFLLRRGINIPSELGFCSLHNADLGVLSFVEAPSELSGLKKDSANYPGCWVK